jgi:low temperature requirement protein LtrA
MTRNEGTLYTLCILLFLCVILLWGVYVDRVQSREAAKARAEHCPGAALFVPCKMP